MEEDSDEANLLDILETHGRQFLNSSLKRKRTEEYPDQENEDFEEWRGFHNSQSSGENDEDEDDGLWLSRRLFVHYNGHILRPFL
jgi:hypothetical protein